MLFYKIKLFNLKPALRLAASCPHKLSSLKTVSTFRRELAPYCAQRQACALLGGASGEYRVAYFDMMVFSTTNSLTFIAN